MNGKVIVFILIFFLELVASCKQNNSAGLPVNLDDSSRIIIARAIAYAGGYDNWNQKQTLSFDKHSISYDSLGNVVREVKQHFDYMLKPEFRAKVVYKLNDTTFSLIHDGQKARKLINGKVSEEQKDIDQAWNSSFGSQFVISMPFKLKDPGINAEYVGQLTLNDGITAQVIKTFYSKGAGSNHTHIWYYYFEPGTGKLLANSLTWEKSKWDFTRYVAFENASGLMVPALRKSYDADSLNKPTWLVSESTHRNITFDKTFPSDYFELPDGERKP